MSPTNSTSDDNLLFGVLAMQANHISSQQFVDACVLWSSRKDASLADVLIEMGAMAAEERAEIQQFVQHRLQREAFKDGPQGGDSPSGIEGIAAQLKAVLKPKQIELLRLHARGGVGQVWLAHDNVLDRDIALKELRSERAGDQRIKDRFVREAKVTAQLSHPGTVPVYEFCELNGQAFYTMKFLKGSTLTEVIEEHHRKSRRITPPAVSLVELLNHFIAACNAVAYAHDRGVIHRDLKGDNIVIGKFGEVTVIDWGLAKKVGEEEPSLGDTVVSDTDVTRQTIQGQPLGTPSYMSPEQALGDIHSMDHRTDVYGLSAILYEILCGVPPFSTGGLAQVIAAVAHKPPDRPSSHSPEAPVALEEICLQGLAKEPQDRQQSVIELRDQVQGWLTEQAERKRTQQEREKFFSISLDLLVIFDRQGRFRLVNPVVEKILGWSTAEFLQMTVGDLGHPEGRERSAAAIQKAIDGGDVSKFEGRSRCRDGSYRWIEWNARLIAGEDLIYAVGRDITERRESEQLFRGLLESAPDAMVVACTDRCIRLVNARAESVFGYDRSQLVGQPIEMLLPERFRKDHPAHFESFVKSPDSRPMGSGLRLVGLRRSGEEFPVEISLSPVQTENGLLIACSVRDFSAE